MSIWLAVAMVVGAAVATKRIPTIVLLGHSLNVGCQGQHLPSCLPVSGAHVPSSRGGTELTDWRMDTCSVKGEGGEKWGTGQLFLAVILWGVYLSPPPHSLVRVHCSCTPTPSCSRNVVVHYLYEES